MKQFTTLIFLACATFSFSQTWVSENAVWHCDYWNLGQTGFYKIKHVGDSVNTEIIPNTLLFFIYSDGSTEKVFRFE